MARKINTRFVIILGSVLFLLALGVLYLVGGNWLRGRDPVYLRQQGEAALKKGDIESAHKFFGIAAAQAAKTHKGADELFVKVGDLSMQLSGTDPVNAQRYYQMALQDWQSALLENPRYLPAHQKLLEEQHRIAAYSGQAAYWTVIEQSATKLIAVAPDYAIAYTYRAEARLELLRSVTGAGNIDAKLKDIESDVKTAIQLDPENPTSAVLLSRVYFVKASNVGSADAAAKLMDSGMAVLHAFLAKHPNNPEASLALTKELQQRKQPDDAIKVLEAAYAAYPKDPLVSAELAETYRLSKPKDAEKILKGLIVNDPGNADNYAMLAAFYEQARHMPEAIDAYKDVLAHIKTGAGIQIFKNSRLEATSLYKISWLSMNEAEEAGPTTPAGETALAQAAAYSDKLRAAQGSRGSLLLLDGRMELLHKKTTDAIAKLKEADAQFSVADSTREQWLQTKLALAQAYEMDGELGTAKQYYDELLKYLTAPQIILRRASLQNRVGNFSDALAAAEPLATDSQPDEIKKAALRIEAQALEGLGDSKKARQLLGSVDSTAAELSIARSLLVQGDMEGAIEQFMVVLKKEPNNVLALNLAIVVNNQLGHKEEAQRLLAQALGFYPKNAQFQLLQAALKEGGNINSRDMQEKMIQSITDDYTRDLTLAQFYRQGEEHDKTLGDRDKEVAALQADFAKELEALQAAEKSSGDSADAGHANLPEAIDREFVVAISLATLSKDETAKKNYFEVAQRIVHKADQFNLDGVNGKLYQGRLEFVRDDQKTGLATLEQAVASRPDFSSGHSILGVAYMEMQNNDAALEQFRLSIQQRPDNMLALKNAIMLLIQKLDTASVEDKKLFREEGQRYLKSAYLFSPRDTQLGAFMDVLGDPAEAIRQRERIRLARPDNLDNVVRLARLYKTNGQPLKAIDLLRPVYDKNQEDLVLADMLAQLYRDTNQPNEAMTMYERFIASKDVNIRFAAMLLLGDMYKSMGQSEQAVQTFQEAIGMQPEKNDQAERRLADLYFDMDDMPKAEGVYQKIFDKEGSDDLTVLRRLAETMIRQDQYDAAAKLLNDSLFKKNPNDPEGLVLQGFAYFRQKKGEQALANFNRVIEVVGENPDKVHYRVDALYYRAFTRFGMGGDLDLATKDLIAVRDLDPKNVNARLLLARVYLRTNHFAEAVAEYAEVMRLQPDLRAARLEYAEFLMELARVQKTISPDSQDEIAYVVRAIDPITTLQNLLLDGNARFPTQPEWKVLQGDLLSLVGQKLDALHTYQDAYVASQGDARTASSFLGALIDTKNYEAAVKLGAAMLAARPDAVDTYTKRAQAYIGLGKKDEATADVKKAFDLTQKNLSATLAVGQASTQILGPEATESLLKGRVDSDSSDIGALVAYGQAQLAANQPAEAVKTFSAVIANPKIGEDVRNLAMRTQALAKYESKDYDGALADYQAVLKNSPDDVESLNNLAFMLADDMKRPKDGLVYAERAMKVLQNTSGALMFLNNGNVVDTYGWVKFLAGDANGAIVQLNRAVQNNPAPVSYLHLAKAYEKSGRSTEAMKSVDEGVKLATAKNDPILIDLRAMQKELGSH